MPKASVTQLDSYRKKRDAERSPEPFGSPGSVTRKSDRLFVIQKHSARHLHWDLRLEIAGTLHSWAVPKGPSLDPEDKRGAFETEDHPIEYADFEGLIPEGSYGAGAMIVWDRGRFVPLEDPEVGLARGKLLFELRGYKLRGLWTLVRAHRNPKEWLWIKKPPTWARANGYGEIPEGGPETFREESILSGLTVEELRAGADRSAAICRELEALGAPRREVDPAQVEVMKPEVAPRPFSSPAWTFELKYDGFRVLASRSAAGPRLLYRSGRDATAVFPEIARAVAALPYGSLLLDSEAVVLEDSGRPSFGLLQKRGQLSRKSEVEQAARTRPVTGFVFDLLAFEGYDLRPLPLLTRKAILARLLPPAGILRYAEDIPEKGEALFQQVTRLALEGLVAKKVDSPYRSGRSGDWLKIRADRTEDFVIAGWAEERGSLRKLHLGAWDGPRLVYAGRVGTGFSGRVVTEIRRQLAPLRREAPPCDGAPRGSEHVWVEPVLVCEVRFKERTGAGNLRQPVFLRLRPDKPPEECILQQEEPAPEPPAEIEAPPPAPSRPVRLTNLKKVFWPGEGLTKGDLIEFYRAIAPWLLPYLEDRPLVLDRYPDGILGKSFYQKNAPESLDGRVRTAPIWSEGSSREIEYLLCDDAEGLVELANLGAIPLHIWSSRTATLGRPDWTILDLDPKGAPFDSVVAIARALHDLCDEVGLPNFIKTSGGSGLHILLPLGARYPWELSRQLAELLARLVVERLPDIATTERVIAARGGRVYLDFLQNGHGKLLAAPFSVRPHPGAPVSTPLLWDEVVPGLDVRSFHLRSVLPRMEALGEDPLLPVLESQVDLAAAIGRLAERL